MRVHVFVHELQALWTTLLMTYCSVEIAYGIAKGPGCPLPNWYLAT